MDPNTAISTGLFALASKDLLSKVLGPTAEYLGEGLRDFSKRRTENIKSIFDRAVRHLGSKLNEPGVVSPRILSRVINDGQYCEDSLVAEYYGGLLASSRGEDANDDRLLPFIEVVRSLSLYEIRTHYVFCHTLKNLYNGEKLSVRLLAERHKLRVYIPSHSWINAIGIESHPNPYKILSEVFYGLGRRRIIDSEALMGPKQFLVKKGLCCAEDHGVIYMLEPFGIDIMLHISGYPDTGSESFLQRSIKLIEIPDINIPIDAKKGELTK